MTDQRDIALYEAYFQSNSEYYIEQLELFNKNGKCGFNIHAFFIGVFWMAYRKMYIEILVIIAIIYLEMSLEELFYDIGFISLNTYEIINIISMIVWSSLFGFFSNRLYILKAKNAISKAVLVEQRFEEVKALLKTKGGTNPFGPILILLVFILMAILGI